jgi:hypothetical protein
MINQEGACSQRRVNGGGLARCSGACFYLRASWPASALRGVRRSEPELGLRPQSLARATRPPASSHWTKRIMIGQDPRFSSGEVPSSCHWPRSRSRWPGRHHDWQSGQVRSGQVRSGQVSHREWQSWPRHSVSVLRLGLGAQPNPQKGPLLSASRSLKGPCACGEGK